MQLMAISQRRKSAEGKYNFKSIKHAASHAMEHTCDILKYICVYMEQAIAIIRHKFLIAYGMVCKWASTSTK